MKRLCIFLAIISTSFLAVSFMPKNVHADVNDFSFSSFDADYYLSKDSDGRSTMKVVERLTAEFVNVDQNHGITRAIPLNYDGHSVSFHFESMTRNGVEGPLYSQNHEGQLVVLSTQRNYFVNGTQKYTFIYTLRDVIKDFGDHQELYWDTNGTGWSQTFDNLNVRVHLDNSIASQFTGAVSCYKGVAGSSTSCPWAADGNTVSFSSEGALTAGENLTFDLGFKSGTFVGYQKTFADFVPLILEAMTLPLLAAAIYMKIRYGRNNRGKGTIIAEYLPPKDVSLFLAAEIANKTATASTAQILDLAVRHKIRIIETEEKTLFIGYKKYTLELLNVDGLNSDEVIFTSFLFGGQEIGSQYVMNKSDRSIGMDIAQLTKVVKKESENQGYRLRQNKQIALQVIVIVAIFALLGVSTVISTESFNNLGVALGIIGIVVVVILTIIAKLGSLRPLTVKGRELFDYLKGLEIYIKLAESERIKMLQSPTRAEKRSIDTDDAKKMVVLYERVLPYAVLFRQEKEWLKQLGMYYESSQSSPGWYSGVSAFNAVSFASSVSSFSSYSNSSSSSSSSGAGGGGASGGGGGGGGGGGV